MHIELCLHDAYMHIRIYDSYMCIADLFLEVGALHLQPVKVQNTLTIRVNMGLVVAKMIQLMMMIVVIFDVWMVMATYQEFATKMASRQNTIPKLFVEITHRV